MVYEIKGAKFNVKLLPVKVETWLDTNHWTKIIRGGLFHVSIYTVAATMPWKSLAHKTM